MNDDHPVAAVVNEARDQRADVSPDALPGLRRQGLGHHLKRFDLLGQRAGQHHCKGAARRERLRVQRGPQPRLRLWTKALQRPPNNWSTGARGFGVVRSGKESAETADQCGEAGGRKLKVRMRHDVLLSALRRPALWPHWWLVSEPPVPPHFPQRQPLLHR